MRKWLLVLLGLLAVNSCLVVWSVIDRKLLADDSPQASQEGDSEGPPEGERESQQQPDQEVADEQQEDAPTEHSIAPEVDVPIFRSSDTNASTGDDDTLSEPADGDLPSLPDLSTDEGEKSEAAPRADPEFREFYDMARREMPELFKLPESWQATEEARALYDVSAQRSLDELSSLLVRDAARMETVEHLHRAAGSLLQEARMRLARGNVREAEELYQTSLRMRRQAAELLMP